MQLDFFATQPHYADHMIPIAKELGEQMGTFFVSQEAHLRTLQADLTAITNIAPRGDNPMLVASHSDLLTAYTCNRNRTFVLMEHGIGLVFPGNPSYAGNKGYRRFASLSLAPNRFVREKTRSVLPDANQEIIGTPFMDNWSTRFGNHQPPGEILKVGLTFHWDGHQVAPEAGNALRHFAHVIPRLARNTNIQLIGHAHPRNEKMMREFFTTHHIAYEPEMQRLFERVDVLVNDCSSIMYYFLLTGKPLVLLNAPWFRRDVDFGIRFWDYADIGEQVNHPDALLRAIQRAYECLPGYRHARAKAIVELFPYHGASAKRAAGVLRKFLERAA